MTISVVSSTDSTVSDSLQISIIPTIANGQITLSSDKDSGKPGDTIYGTVVITNLGTSEDTMRVNSVDLDCGLSDAEVVLNPSMSSSPIPWSCTIPTDETAGVKVELRLTSSRSDMLVTFSCLPLILLERRGHLLRLMNDLFDKVINTVSTVWQINTFVEGSLNGWKE